MKTCKISILCEIHFSLTCVCSIINITSSCFRVLVQTFQIPRSSMQHAPCPSCIFQSYGAACSILFHFSATFINYSMQAYGQIFFRMQTMSNLHSMHSLHSSAILTNIKLIYFIRGNITDRYFSSCR